MPYLSSVLSHLVTLELSLPPPSLSPPSLSLSLSFYNFLPLSSSPFHYHHPLSSISPSTPSTPFHSHFHPPPSTLTLSFLRPLSNYFFPFQNPSGASCFTSPTISACIVCNTMMLLWHFNGRKKISLEGNNRVISSGSIAIDSIHNWYWKEIKKVV